MRLICASCGIEQATLQNSASYIANWLRRLESDPDLLVTPPLVIQSDPTRLGRVAAEMALERLDGLAGPARLVVHPVGRHDVAQEIAR